MTACYYFLIIISVAVFADVADANKTLLLLIVIYIRCLDMLRMYTCLDCDYCFY
jgi:hypothetical protein